MVVAAIHANKEQTPEKYEHISYISAITQDECYVCGDVKTFAGSFYWGQDNLGIVNLNTFELLRLEIKRYNDHGNLIAEPAGFMSSGGMAKDDAGSSVHAFCFPDNGYADVQLSVVQYAIDRNAIQNCLCQTCLDSINDLWADQRPMLTAPAAVRQGAPVPHAASSTADTRDHRKSDTAVQEWAVPLCGTPRMSPAA